MNTVKYIKWENVYSGETGYVQMIRHAKSHFVNTPDKEQARKYRSESEAKQAINDLVAMGEGRTNVFTIVD